MTTASGLHGDMPVGGWIDRFAPPAARPYLRLARLDRPIGTWLLLFPCWWSLALAGPGPVGAWRLAGLVALFAVGAVVMRGAGCTVNDILDRDIDSAVSRTAARPLAAGHMGLKGAVAALGVQLALGLVVLVQLPPFAIALGAASLLLVFPYPLMKRITWWPQAWLGLTFNWGALLGWAAVHEGLGWPPVVLYAAGFFWTLGYDTIYAHQDKTDDALVGVKSSARRLGAWTRPAVSLFYALALGGIAAAGALNGLSWPVYPLLGLAGLHFAWQVATLDTEDGANCLRRFKSNRWVGWLVVVALAGGHVL